MRVSPLWGYVALVLAAILVAGLASRGHKNTGDLPPVEQAQQDAQKAADAANKQTNAKPAAAAQPGDTTMMTFDKARSLAVRATMVIENRGTVVMELYPKAAPKTVAHFIDLCKKHFYDGLKFHRVEPGFVIQGGDPESKGASVDEFESKGIGQHGSGQSVPLEAHLPHTVNSVGLARSQDPNSGDCQFYINLKDNNELDGKYCVFGMVVQGQDVAPSVEKGDVIKSITVQ